MKKFLFIFLNLILLNLYSSIIFKSYNLDLTVPYIFEKEEKPNIEKKTFFTFRISDLEGEFNFIGFWRIKVGYGIGFTLFPELKWLMTYPNLTKGLIFEQSKLLCLDWNTSTGVFLHLFFDDDIENSQFTFRYDQNRFLQSFYITNNPDEIKINPFRKVIKTKSTDITVGFNFGNEFYKGDFIIKTDSATPKLDKFTGSGKEINKIMLSTQFIRGTYFFLPDKNLTGNITVYLYDPTIEVEYPDIVLNGIKFKKLNENIDYVIDKLDGFIKFKRSVFKTMVIIYYEVNINNRIYPVGSNECGKNAINNTVDFNKSAYPEYFISGDGKDYLIISFPNKFSIFEEKNSYYVTQIDAQVSYYNTRILTKNQKKVTGFYTNYDSYTGCIRVFKSKEKGTIYNIYPFFDSVNPDEFYLTFYSPEDNKYTHIIDFSCYLKNISFKLTDKPIISTIKVFYNSQIIDNSKYYYDPINQSIIFNFEPNSTDLIEVYYLSEEKDDLNLTLSLKNEFRLNRYILLGDSLWYKMPLKLWEESYYDDLHAIELLYFINFKYDLSSLLFNNNSELSFNLSTGLSFYYPELNGVTIIEDFEREIKGYKISLNYSYWYPVNIPSGAVYSELITAQKGKLYYRNMHKGGVYNDDIFLSIYESNVKRESYTNGATIGPYSSCDGFTYNLSQNKFIDVKNSLSLITEFELDTNEAFSIAFPVKDVDNVDFTKFNGLNIALKRESLIGEVWLFVDAGEITERFNLTDTVVQRENLDEGIKYFIEEEGIFLYKSKNDGKKITNDFDLNGVLDSDNPAGIARFIDSESLNNYYIITKKYNNINFIIDNPKLLKNFRGIRVTLYSPTGASGRFIINQIRFIESGWKYNSIGDSKASEISPIEDSYLLKHIFSKENYEIDKKIHFQRFRERTLKITLKQNEPFDIEKEFVNPIDITNFNKITFFILFQNRTERILKITLKDTKGNSCYATKKLEEFSEDKWHKIEFHFNTFNDFNKINKLISTVKLSFLNEISDISDNFFYIDEFIMEEPVPAVGGTVKFNFTYLDSEYQIKRNKFTLFGSPYINWNILFTSSNFLHEERLKLKDSNLGNEIFLQFTFSEVNYYFFSKLNFIFQNYTPFNKEEKLTVKLGRLRNDFSPLTFIIFYDYSKYVLFYPIYSTRTENKTETRTILIEIGTDLDYFKFKTGYEINSIKKIENSYNSQLYLHLSYQRLNTFSQSMFEIKNNGVNKNTFGCFSLDNLGYFISNDFLDLFKEGNRKEIKISISNGTFLINPLYVTHNFMINQIGENEITDESFLFLFNYENSIQLDLILKFMNENFKFFTTKFKRYINNSHKNRFKTIFWNEYLSELNKSITSSSNLFFLPPFSSLYMDKNKSYFVEVLCFDALTDSLLLKWDWSVYVKKILLIPKSFSFEFIEMLKNKFFFNKSYLLDFTVNSENQLSLALNLDIFLNYSLNEKINLEFNNNNYKTEAYFSAIFSFLKTEFQGSIIHEHIIRDGYTKSSEHLITVVFSFYKNFYREREITKEEYGFDMLHQIEIKSSFHKSFYKEKVFKTDTPFDILYISKVGYKFNKNFNIYSNAKAGYCLDYNQNSYEKINRFALEFSIEGQMSF